MGNQLSGANLDTLIISDNITTIDYNAFSNAKIKYAYIVGFGVAENQLIDHISQKKRQIHGLDAVFLVDMAVHEAVDEEVVDGRCHHFHPLLGKPVQDV